MQAIARLRSAWTAYNEPKFDGHQAIPAIIAQDDALYHTQFTPLGQTGVGEEVSAFTQVEKFEMVEILTQTMVEISTKTEELEGSAVVLAVGSDNPLRNS